MKKHRFDFDGALKNYFETQRPGLLTRLTGGIGVKQFLNVELPTIRSRKVDLLLLLENDTILQIELQSTNHRDMVLRMAEYYVLLKRKFGKPVRQVVLYFGDRRMSMSNNYRQDAMQFSYELMDIRSWSADELLASEHEADQVLALLAGGRADTLQLIRDVLGKIALMDGPGRERALVFAEVLAGLRGFERIVLEESIHMGQLIDWRKNEVLRGYYEEARVEGREEGRQMTAEMLKTVLTQTFGPLPRWAQRRIVEATHDQLKKWGSNVVDAQSIETVIGPRV